MKFVTKEQWGSNQSKEATEDSHPIGSTLGVTLHWVGPGMGYPWAHSTCDDRVRGIERHHEYGNGWGDIAYNLLACPHGYVYEGRGVGVRSAANGGTQSNEDWYAVCYLGGLGDGFSPDGEQAMRDAVNYLRNRGNAGPRVNGHRDHKGTDCPGNTIYGWLQAADFSNTRPVEEDVTPDDIQKIAAAVWTRDLDGATAKTRLVRADRNVHRANEKLAGQFAALRKAVDGNASPAEVRALLDNLDATIQLVVNEVQE